MNLGSVFPDTIAAVSTAPGSAYRAVVRISGPGALEIAARLVHAPGPLVRAKGFTCPEAELTLPGNGQCKVRLLIMRAPRSYTRENMVEVHIPGAPALAELVLSLCLQEGARLAGPGEFTRRAYLNGRIDATQVEGVLALVESRSDEERKAALHLLQGGNLTDASEVRRLLLEVLAGIEAYLDFAEEDTEEVDHATLRKQLRLCLEKLEHMEARLSRRVPFRNLPRVVILGPPNAGKSSLFKALVPRARPMVSPIPGTTRDLLEGEVTGHARPFLLYDAPGVSHSRDPLERLARSQLASMMGRMDVALFLFDGSRAPQRETHARLQKMCAGLPCTVALNKADLPVHSAWREIRFENQPSRCSARRGDGLNELVQALTEFLPPPAGEGSMGMDHRTRAVVTRAGAALREALRIDWEGGLELVALEIREATESLGDLAGKITDEEILDRVFSRFCIGK